MYDVDENGMIDLNEMTRLVKSIFKVSQSKVIGSLPPSLPLFIFIIQHWREIFRNLLWRENYHQSFYQNYLKMVISLSETKPQEVTWVRQHTI